MNQCNPYQKDTLSECSFDLRERDDHSESRFPKIIHQTWQCDSIPAKFHNSMESWRSLNPDYEIILWTEDLQKDFIISNLGTEAFELYDTLTPGSLRSDLFRYIALFFLGGFYADLDSTLLIPLQSLPQDVDYISAIDLDGWRILQGAVMGSVKGFILWECVIGEVFQHIKQRFYPQDPLDISGPGVIAECLAHITGNDMYPPLISPGRKKYLTFSVFLFSSKRERGVHSIWYDERKVAWLGIGELSGQEYPMENITDPKCVPPKHYQELARVRNVYGEKGKNNSMQWYLK